jgi:hypothetical protein
MKTLLLALGVVAAGVVGVLVWRRATERARAWTAFQELEGRDLQSNPSDRIRSKMLFARFCPMPDWPRTPWTVLRVGPRWIGLSRDPVPFATGREWDVCAWERGKVVGKGLWAKDVELLSARAAPEFDGLGLLMEKGGERRLQIRAFVDERLALVREETSDGRARPADWAYGGGGPQGSTESWVERLRQEEPLVVLEGLCWLGARGGSLGGYRRQLLSELRPELERLAKSPNSWIREAAELALR